MSNYFDRDKREDWRAAFHAARDAAVGKSRDEVRDLYLAELRSRGVDAPPDDYLELDITRLVRNAGRSHVPQAGALLPQYRPGRETKFLYPDRSAEPIPVILEPGAGEWLAAGRHLPRGADPATRIDVWLDFATTTAAGWTVGVHVRDFLVGVMPAAGGDEFRAEVEDARQRGYYLMTSGFLVRRDGSWPGLSVYRFAAE